MEVNEAIEKLGYTGKWQSLVFILIIFMLMPSIVWNELSLVLFGWLNLVSTHYIFKFG